MTTLEQLIYDFLKDNTLMTLLDNEDARSYTEEKAVELAGIMTKYFNPDKCNLN